MDNDKKCLVVVAAIFSAFCFFGCGANDPAGTEPTQTLAESTGNTEALADTAKTSHTANSQTSVSTASKQQTSSSKTTTVSKKTGTTQTTQTTQSRVKDGMDMIEEAIRQALISK